MHSGGCPSRPRRHCRRPLDSLEITFLLLALYMTVVTVLQTTERPAEMPESPDLDLTPSRGARLGGVALVLATVVLNAVFW